jgi:ABC-type phosphate/phosphonate transport system substrate-binding protein
MFRPGARGLSITAFTLVVSAFAACLGSAGEKGTGRGPVRIGLISTLFRDTPESTAVAMMQPLGSLMESQTGVRGQLVPGGTAMFLGQQLVENKVQIGVFHGVEFAWARQRYPQLKPLVIAINQQRHLRAYVMVREDKPVPAFADLKDQTFSLSRGSREHSLLFLNRLCGEVKQDPKTFFAKVSNPGNAEDALDEVADGLVRATVVDGVTLECYKRRKPGRFGKLKPICESEVFPAAVIAYCPGQLDDKTLDNFRAGLLNCTRSAQGKHLLTLWRLTAFEPVPPDYDQTLAAIVKAYPPPAEAAN